MQQTQTFFGTMAFLIKFQLHNSEEIIEQPEAQFKDSWCAKEKVNNEHVIVYEVYLKASTFLKHNNTFLK